MAGYVVGVRLVTDLAKVDVANAALQADPKAAKSVKFAHAAVVDALHAMNPAPPPPPPPPPPSSGGWGSAWAQVPRADQSQAGQAFASYAGAPGYAAASCAVYVSKAGDPVYTFNTGNLDPGIPIAHGTQPGGSDDRTLVVIAPTRVHSINGASYDAAADRWTCNSGVSLNTGEWFEPKTNKQNDSSSASRIAIGTGAIVPSEIGKPPTHALRLRISTGSVGAPPCPYPANTIVGGPGGSHATFGWWLRLIAYPPLTGDPLTDYVNAVLYTFGAVVTDGGSQITVDMVDPVNQGGTVAGWAAVGVQLVNQGGLYVAKLDRVPWASLQALNPPAA